MALPTPPPEHISDTNFSRVQYVEVDANSSGQRIDNFLISLLKSAPRSLVYRLLRTGQVRVNKGRAKPKLKLNVGDVVRIPPITLAPADKVHLPAEALRTLEKSIVRDDEDWVFLDKPAGLAVHSGTGVRYGVIDLAQHLFDNKEVSLVHRLDRETSGCLVLAKHRKAAVHFQQCLREGKVAKRYTAIVAGFVRRGFTENAPLRKNQPQDGERMVIVDRKAGKSAKSIFTIVQQGSATSVVDVEIETGRTHQIRVHAAYRGHPVLGDSRYGDRQLNRRLVATFGKRMYLHAAEISFPPFEPQQGDVRSIRHEADTKPDWLVLHKTDA